MHNSTLTRKSRLKRHTPLARGTKPLRRTRLRRRSPKKAIEDRVYAAKRRAYLEAHPLCQATIAENNLDEKECIHALKAAIEHGQTTAADFIYLAWEDVFVPRATQIHHRNKRTGRRQNDERFWISVSTEMHEKIEGNKDWARGRGLLLPINADPDGRAGGKQYPTTPELLEQRRAEKGPPVNF